jgi:glycogen synthase
VHTWYEEREDFDQLRKNAMRQRFDWKVAAREYVSLYRSIIRGRRKKEEQI